MGPPVASPGLDPGAVSDPLYGNRQHLVLAVGRSMTIFGEASGNLVVTDALTGEIECAMTHLFAPRQSGDGVDPHFHLEVANGTSPPDDPDQSDIVRAPIQYDLFD